MRLLLHACCGPCLLEPIDELSVDHDVDVLFVNPNIHPVEEYERRRDTLLDYAEEHGIAVTELDYDPVMWMRAVAGTEDDPAARCRACYHLRLGMTARHAAAADYEAISTTLSVSPYQDAEAIREEGEAAAEAAGISFVARDFRERYPDATRRSRELGMYRQKYCGCLLSEIEARAQREERRRARKQSHEKAGSDG